MQENLQANALDASYLASFDGLEVLSLDCFDTLLWRKVVAPTDVFFALAHSAAFQKMGLSAPLRAKAETAARSINWINLHSVEVSLEQIYRQALPHAGAADIDELTAAELACEIDYCFVFKPVFDLIVQAKARGLIVIVVSDTYLSEAQLRTLLFSCEPALEGVIDAVFCSNVHKLSKGDGIWRVVLPQLKVRPEQVLHLGDNKDADFVSPQRFGMRATHFVQQGPACERMLRGRTQVATQLLPEVHHKAAMPSYHHAQIAVAQLADPLEILGYAAMGPVLYAFADFVLREARECRAGGKPLRIAFLLRDGLLPARACAALAGEPVGSELNISRFTAIAASLHERDAVVALLSKTLSRVSMPFLVAQLMLPPELGANILRLAAKAALPEREFARLVLEQTTLNVIVAQSRSLRARLVRHVRKVTGVQAGDTLMFVDLGYSGTAQTLLKDILKQDLDVDLIGRYLLADEVAPHQSDRKGLIDATHMDGRIVQALTGSYIASFEMLCTQSAPSTVAYTDDGDPVFAATTVGHEQQAMVGLIQAACVRFVADVRATPSAHKPVPDAREMARSAAIDLARLLYFPSQMEMDCMNTFQFDFNLGTDKNIALFDAGKGLRAMRTQGFAYMNGGLDDMRTSYTMELRAMDLSLSVMLFAQNRFGFDMQPATASYRKETVQVLVTNQSQHTVREMVAHHTYEGFFALSVPLSASFNVGVLVGKQYSWVQIDSVQLIIEGDLQHGTDMAPGEAILFDQMIHTANGLFEVAPGGMLYLPGLDHYRGALMCRIVFRPIAWVDFSKE